MQTWNQPTTPESGAEEDAANDSWADLDDWQRLRLWGLSADLCTLRDSEQPQLGGSDFREDGPDQWDGLLALLRQRPAWQLRAPVDFIRGWAWRELGEPCIALLFFENAAWLQPDNTTYSKLVDELEQQITAADIVKMLEKKNE